jgi:hypothetical protein
MIPHCAGFASPASADVGAQHGQAIELSTPLVNRFVKPAS